MHPSVIFVGVTCPAQASVFAEAINVTLRTIEKRTRLYRSLLVGVWVVSLLSIVSALVLRNPTLLIGFGLLVPLAGSFFLLDCRQVGKWQEHLFNLWLGRGLRFEPYGQSMSSHPRVPPRTIEEMLSLLPSESAGRKIDELLPDQKAAVASASKLDRRRQEFRTGAGVLASTLITGLVVASALSRSSSLLVCAVGCFVTWGLLRRKL